MQARVLIVEDEFIVALHLKHVLIKQGFDVVGIAPDLASVVRFADAKPDIALVDVNLRDGPTGPEIGELLARKHGASVMFITANPRQIFPVPSGPLGVVTKPINDNEIGLVLDFIVRHRHGERVEPPANMTLFGTDKI